MFEITIAVYLHEKRIMPSKIQCFADECLLIIPVCFLSYRMPWRIVTCHNIAGAICLQPKQVLNVNQYAKLMFAVSKPLTRN
jgi:hypothetical protein